MRTLIAFILSNSSAFLALAGAAAVAIFGAFMRRSGVKAERNANRAKDADAYEQHLKDLERAANAGNAVRPNDVDGMRDDPFNRDR